MGRMCPLLDTGVQGTPGLVLYTILRQEGGAQAPDGGFMLSISVSRPL
jgi:hypothetical protein